jgi:hypothetical protein
LVSAIFEFPRVIEYLKSLLGAATSSGKVTLFSDPRIFKVQCSKRGRGHAGLGPVAFGLVFLKQVIMGTSCRRVNRMQAPQVEQELEATEFAVKSLVPGRRSTVLITAPFPDGRFLSTASWLFTAKKAFSLDGMPFAGGWDLPREHRLAS